ncbi:MAG: ATP-binding protein, partial [Anaerolineae bacterium]
TAEDASGLLYYVARQMRENALLHRRLRLPALKREDLAGDPYIVFLDWLGTVEQSIGQRLIMLNLDEFERLEEMTQEGRLDQRIFNWLRGLIQHHPKLVVLFSGSHTLEDLAPFWSDYLISVRVLRVGPLEEGEARELIVEPKEDFPLRYEEEAVERIITATGRQPYLIQATCRDLVNHLNEDRRLQATVRDVEWALESCMVSGAGYFQELWAGRDSDETQQAVLLAVAKDTEGALSDSTLARRIGRQGLPAALRRLVHREILERSNGVYRFRVELIRRWVQKEVLTAS